MEETDKIWMNGELIDWADATVHVGVHGLHYGSGVFEGIRCYETPKGPAVFRLADHMQRLHDSARLLYMDIPYSVEDLREATHELIRVNALPACYLRPIAFYGYGQLGVSTQGNPVETVIMSWPWGAYLGEGALENGITACISSWKRVGPNTIPHASKASGVYLNSMLATTEARRGGYDEGILLTDDGFVADGPGENIFVVKNGVIRTPPLSTSILPGPDPRCRDHDRAGSGLRRRGDAADPLGPLPRRRVLHDRHRRRGDAGAGGRRSGARRRPCHAGDPDELPGHGQRSQRPLVALARRRRHHRLGRGRRDALVRRAARRQHRGDDAVLVIVRHRRAAR